MHALTGSTVSGASARLVAQPRAHKTVAATPLRAGIHGALIQQRSVFATGSKLITSNIYTKVSKQLFDDRSYCRLII